MITGMAHSEKRRSREADERLERYFTRILTTMQLMRAGVTVGCDKWRAATDCKCVMNDCDARMSEIHWARSLQKELLRLVLASK